MKTKWNFLGLCLLLISLHGVAQDRITELTDTLSKPVIRERLAKDEEFRNPATSPLPAEDIPDFKGLPYFDYQLKYRVKARFERVTDAVPFKMQTTTSRRPEYVHFANVYFTIDAHEYKLEVYQNLDLIKKPGYEKHLFLPFSDETCGRESYGGGRYLDLQQPADDRIVIDFNTAYNPYCCYNSRYSCPIPPEQNDLPVRIEAGEKNSGRH